MSQQKLKPYQWKNRLILISEENETARKYFSEIKEKHSKDWQDRKLLLIELSGSDYKQATQQESKVFAALYGLDGGLKKVYQTSPSASELLQIIDSMPMRQQEMQSKESQED